MRIAKQSVYWVIAIAMLVAGRAGAEDRLTLADCIAAAVRSNSILENARYQAQAARAERTGSYAGILPAVRTGFDSRRTHIAPTVDNRIVIDGIELGGRRDDWNVNNSYRWGASVSQVLYDGGRSWNQIKMAKSVEMSADAGVRDIRSKTIIETAVGYLTLLKEMNSLEIFEKSLQLAETQLGRARALSQAGSVAQIDVIRSEINRNNARLGVMEERTRIEIARAELNRVMGRAPGEPLDIVSYEPKVAPLEYGVEELASTAYEASPELENLRHAADAADYSTRIARGSLMPVVRFDVNYSRNNSVFGGIYGNFGKNFNWSYGATVSFNIFDGYRTKSAIQVSEANSRIALENIEATKQMIGKNVTSNYMNYQTAFDQIQVYQDIASQTEENMRLVEIRYQEGAGTIHEVLDAQETLTQARIELIQKKFDAIMWRARLEVDTGMNLGEIALFSKVLEDTVLK